MRKKFLEALTHKWTLTVFLGACVVGGMGHMSFGCNGWDPRRPFERNNPDVDRAIEMVEDGQYENAEEILSQYLNTDVCEGPKIGIPKDLKKKADGTFDLGLVIFYLAEKYGERFGDEKKLLEKIDAGGDLGPLADEAIARDEEVECGLLIALAIAKDTSLAPDLRARAWYVAGNMNFLRMAYPKAILAYEESLKLIPGIVEEAGGDGIGRDAAWNRAVALRRLEELLADGGADGGEDGDDGDGGTQPQEPDGDAGDGEDGDGAPGQLDGDMDGGLSGDSGEDGGEDGGDAGGLGADGEDGDGGNEGPDGSDPQGGDDAGDGTPPPQPSEDGTPEDQDPTEGDGTQSGPGESGDRVLDRFDQTPTYQQEESKKNASKKPPQMEDK